MGVKGPCLRPLGDTPLLPVFPGRQSAYIPEELILGIGCINPTTPLPDAEASFHRGKSSDGGHGRLGRIELPRVSCSSLPFTKCRVLPH